MEHRKLEGLMSPMEKVARVASGGLRAASAQTSPSGAISLDNADGTRTIIGEVANGEDNPSYTMATHVGDTTPPGIPTGITATSRSGVVVVEWDGTLSGGIPDDFFCVRIYLDNVELGALSEAGSVASAKLQSGTTVSITATSEDDCCLPDGTPAHNVSDATQAISVTVAKDASEVMADIDEQIEGVEQEIADFKSNTYTKAETDKKVQDLDDEISTELTTNYYNKNQIDASYATKTLVSQTKEEIELSASQTYANKGAGNPNLSPFYAHDLSDVYDATDNPDGYWTETPARATQLDDGWAHIVLDNSSGTGTMYSRTYIRPMEDVPERGTLMIEIRNLVTNVTSQTTAPRLWFNASASNSQMYRNVVYFVEGGTYRLALVKTNNANPTHFARWWWGIEKGGTAEFDARISVYANTEATIDGQQVTLPYEGSFKPYVTDQAALSKEYSTKAELTVGLDGIRTEVSGTYATKGAGNPNLTPLTAHDLRDRYNATTNPGGYWRADLSWAENISDGWAHVELEPATGTRWGQQFQTVLLPDLKPSTKYTLLMEYRNVSVTGTLTAWPLYSSSDQFVYPPETTAFTVDRDMVVRAQLMTKDSFEGIVSGVDARHRLVAPSGGSGSCSYDLRLSIYECELDGEGDPIPYDGAYKPYVTDQESLSKTYTKSSTFTQTVDGLDGRITATEDGITLLDTLIRLFQGGVLAGYVGNAVSALMNAAGSFDVVQTTWQDGEPTIVDTLASFGASLVEIGKNSANAVIDFCAGGVRIAYDSVRAGFNILSSLAVILESRGTSNQNVSLYATEDNDPATSYPAREAWINAHASSAQGSASIHLEAGECDSQGSRSSGGVINILDYGTIISQSGFIVLTAGDGVRVDNSANNKLGTLIGGIFFGSKIINPNGAAYGTLFTQAECVSSFGRALSQAKDVVLVMNGDTGVYSGQMTASLNSSSEVRVYMSPTRSGATRVNYLVVLGA